MALETQEEMERKMLQRVGILPKPPVSRSEVDVFYRSLSYLVSRFLETSLEEENPLIKRIECLEKTVQELKKEKEIIRKPSKADLIYLKFKDKLEKEHFGKIVAIDVESQKIVGIGNSILEAYQEARKNSPKQQFSYRRVGFDFIHKL